VLKDENAYQIPSALSEQRRLIGVGYMEFTPDALGQAAQYHRERNLIPM